jgi:cell wall-associated NlpC family hydrolase
MRTLFAILLISLLMLIAACTPMPRFTNPPKGGTTVNRFPEEPPKHFEPSQPILSRIDADKMNKIIARYMDTPYQRGGSGSLGLDCSGFVYVVYRDYDGTRLPLTVQTLYRLEDRVNQSDLTYGDLVFFRTEPRKVSHVGIYIGGGKFVHASESRGVALDSIDSEAFSSIYAGARRIK